MDNLDGIISTAPGAPSSEAAEKTAAPPSGPVLLAACAYCGQESIQRSGGLGKVYIAAWEEFREAWRSGDLDRWDLYEADIDRLEPLIHAAFDSVLLRYPRDAKEWIRFGDFSKICGGSYVPILSHILSDSDRDPRYALSHGICPAHFEEMMGHPCGEKNGKEIGP